MTTINDRSESQPRRGDDKLAVLLLGVSASIFVLATVFLGSSCAQTRYATTSIEQAIDNPVTQTYDWGEVYCGRGTVCAEVEVLRVDIEHRDGGRIQLVLHNRTGDQVSVQIGLEILDANGARLDQTSFQDVGLQPRQERSWEMPGIFRQGAKVRVVLRQRV